MIKVDLKIYDLFLKGLAELNQRMKDETSKVDHQLKKEIKLSKLKKK